MEKNIYIYIAQLSVKVLVNTIFTIKLHHVKDSADDILGIFFLFFLENRIWHFMQIVF